MWKMVNNSKLVVGVVSILIIVGLGYLGSAQQDKTLGASITASPTVVVSPSPTLRPSPTPSPNPTPSPAYSPLPRYQNCSNGSYINSDGQSVCRPDLNHSNIQCSDGTYSHSTHRQGACSHHGGIN